MTPLHARIRVACALLAVCVASLVSAGLPLAAVAESSARAALPATPPAGIPALAPIVDCVQDAPLGAVTSRTVVLGYRSAEASPVAVAAGSGSNDLGPGRADRGQPTTFQPGVHHGAWLLTVDALAEPTLTWTLGAAVATIDGSAPACTDATAVAIGAPTAASAAGTISVTATVTRFLLGPPDSGAVSFAFDGGATTTAPVDATGIARAELPAPAAGTRTLTATFTPTAGSTLRPATASSEISVAAASGPLSVFVDSVVGGSSAARVSVTRTVAAGAASVAFRTVDGTAHAGTDFLPASGTIALADGQSSATTAIQLPRRAPGSPAATFFVVLERATVGVDSAVAVVSLPAVPAASAAAASVGGPADHGGGTGPASALPEADPTAPTPVAAAPVGQDLLLLLGAVLITVGGIAGVIGLVRAVRTHDALS